MDVVNVNKAISISTYICESMICLSLFDELLLSWIVVLLAITKLQLIKSLNKIKSQIVWLNNNTDNNNTCNFVNKQINLYDLMVYTQPTCVYQY